MHAKYAYSTPLLHTADSTPRCAMDNSDDRYRRLDNALHVSSTYFQLPPRDGDRAVTGHVGHEGTYLYLAAHFG